MNSVRKMVVRHKIEGYESFVEFMKNFKNDGENIHILFTGSKLPTGESWCPDCVVAHPVIEESLDFAEEKSHFIEVEVGDRKFWKDPNCPFRKNPDTRLNVIPSIIRWKSPQRLEGEQCAKKELLEMLFTD